MQSYLVDAGGTIDFPILGKLKVAGLSRTEVMQLLESKMQQVEYRITIKLGTLFVIGFTTMATLLKYWLVR